VAILAALLTAAILPGFTPVAVGPSGGQVLTGPLPGTGRPGYVYLPPGFSPLQRYPTAYLLHGMPGSPSEFVDGAGLLDWADGAIGLGVVRPFIAVMPAAGTTPYYNGEWAGPWERALVDDVVPWVDASLPTIRRPRDRVLAGLSAGGFGAYDIALRNPGRFGVVESWSGYFAPLHDGPFKGATQNLLDANDPRLLARTEAARLRADGTRFFLSTGPFHSHWFRPAQTTGYARELMRLGLPVRLLTVASAKGEYSTQLADGLAWALAP
jgi:S-formylglutathione hydrolase FrmB